jgi:hypothetical protein
MNIVSVVALVAAIAYVVAFADRVLTRRASRGSPPDTSRQTRRARHVR